MLPICHPIGGSFFHREYGKPPLPFYPAPRFWSFSRTSLLPRSSPFR
jgi:hypothetical protein